MRAIVGAGARKRKLFSFGKTPIEEKDGELVEVEIVGLLEPLELEVVLGGDDGGRTTAQTTVVDASDGCVVVGEFEEDIGRSEQRRGWVGEHSGSASTLGLLRRRDLASAKEVPLTAALGMLCREEAMQEEKR
ncbi:hypothetical protein F3Y22_tig00110302pilonHSYRG00006 [Hibiscus syriacus]|uniref:Uncharacterized protein n=1 Tax=Hibiscus syriacus TaxID=106335 RepID=A0A6A3B8A3_HIBSY|nr:hypothetical protein F3Y22_tig00110302pilonHSYRG00006 [Hibiscus syriacus]